jgi:hypothetical protein
MGSDGYVPTTIILAPGFISVGFLRRAIAVENQ